MYVEKFVKIGEHILFNSKEVKGNHNYIIKVSNYMTLKHFPLIKWNTGEDP